MLQWCFQIMSENIFNTMRCLSRVLNTCIDYRLKMTVDLGGKLHRIIGHYNIFKDIHIFPKAYGTSENRMYFNTLLKNKHSKFFFRKKITVH